MGSKLLDTIEITLQYWFSMFGNWQPTKQKKTQFVNPYASTIPNTT